MKSSPINLHTDHKLALSAVVLFSVVSIILNVIVGITINEKLTGLNALIKSEYAYSVITHKSVAVDDYYQFNAGISFAISPAEKTRINAEVLMQSESSDYTQAVFWNAGALDKTDVAVSKGIAKRYGLHVGDVLFSKHYVDGEIHEYSIKQILPDVIHSRITEQNSFCSGVIIMGYDQKYVDNITHTWITFTDRPIEELSADGAVAPEDIIYRDDEIKTTVIGLLPYAVILSASSALCVFLFLAFMSKSCSYNFRRLIILGFDKEGLDRAYRRLTGGFGVFAILVTTLVSAVIFNFLNICPIGFILLCWIAFLEVIVLWITSAVLKGRLWRR